MQESCALDLHAQLARVNKLRFISVSLAQNQSQFKDNVAGDILIKPITKKVEKDGKSNQTNIGTKAFFFV